VTGVLFGFMAVRRQPAGHFPVMTRGHGPGGRPPGGGPARLRAGRQRATARAVGGPQGTGPATGRQAGAGITSRTQTAANADSLPVGPYRDHNDPRSLKPQSRRESRAVCIRLSSTIPPRQAGYFMIRCEPVTCPRQVGSGRLPAPAIIVFAGNCFSVACHAGGTVIRIAAEFAGFVAVPPIS
jgi:hypothetical protein